MKILALAVTLFFLSVCQAGAFTRSNFETPESFIADPEDGVYYVSNIKGSPTQKDGDGYISKISRNGNIVIQKFINSKKSGSILHAPKGLLIHGRQMWVTDIDTVKIFDKKSAKFSRLIDFSSFAPKFLNDIAADADGKVYVSDMLTDRIFLIEPALDYRLSVYKEGSELGNPNGLVVNQKNKNLMVVTFKTGEILEIDRQKKVHVLKRGLKGLDGIDYDGEGNLFVSSFEKGEIYRIPFYGRGTLSTYLADLITPADISFDRKRSELLIPSFRGNTCTSVYLFEKRSQRQ